MADSSSCFPRSDIHQNNAQLKYDHNHFNAQTNEKRWMLVQIVFQNNVRAVNLHILINLHRI